MEKREIELLVLSDIHLGTYGCQAKELYHYLKSVKPKTVVLNGDIIDIWLFSKKYWPSSHMKVVKQILNYLANGCDVYYITGNHDEMLRKFKGFRLDNFEIVNKVVLSIDGKKVKEVIRIDGYKLYFGEKHWLMFRFSGTEPLLRIYCEAPSKEKALESLSFAKGLLEH